MADKQAIMRALQEATGSSAPMKSRRPMARPNMIGASPSGGTRGIDPAENYSPEGLMRLLNQGMGESGKTISDADRARVMGMMGESGKTISDADKMRVRNMMGASGKTISDADMMRIKSMLREKGGGMKKPMGFKAGGAVQTKRTKKPKMGCVMKGRGGKYKGQS